MGWYAPEFATLLKHVSESSAADILFCLCLQDDQKKEAGSTQAKSDQPPRAAEDKKHAAAQEESPPPLAAIAEKVHMASRSTVSLSCPRNLEASSQGV